MRGSFGKYKQVYSLLWRTYGQSGLVRLSFIVQLLGRTFKLVALPVAVSLIITRLSAQDFDGAFQAVLLYAAFSFTLGVLTPLHKYIGMKGENPVYERMTGDFLTVWSRWTSTTSTPICPAL